MQCTQETMVRAEYCRNYKKIWARYSAAIGCLAGLLLRLSLSATLVEKRNGTIVRLCVGTDFFPSHGNSGFFDLTPCE